ncbi:alpha/beta hydrolase family protein [Novosphingobium rosa]|uniref:hypothetical protein n=1 Tax=Novosphingobium rosa TaxID=76978 RepID=UPI0008324B4B|nr:hypothetical protein [Novosphingobium rosa]
MRYTDWSFTAPDGSRHADSALWLGESGPRLLIVPALLDEGHRLRRLSVEVMRRLANSGITCILPDLPGTGDSDFPLEQADLALWRKAMGDLAQDTGAQAVFALRGGALAAPEGLAGWHYAPIKGASILRQLIRARIIASREAGVEERQDALMEQGRAQGLELAGYRLGAAMIAQLGGAQPATEGVSPIDQELVSGAPLWLRAEPGESREQADALAAILAIGLRDGAKA